ncbi:MAG: hypothetical protein CO189_09585 [candidate division Zixibacteria bacterium CG_4_9_14_3_um_filter_46_8]|nr:MAG: hypothetical protein CO189_09585 [candidate division Zixibacteria bacterium CG_4_9_14_3_um_filter_46_8]
MADKAETAELQEQKFKLVIEYLREIMQQAQFVAVNIAIAADVASKSYGTESELGKALLNLASESTAATQRVEELSRVAIEGLNTFDYNSLTKKKDIDPQTLGRIEVSFEQILIQSKKVMEILKRLNLKHSE